MSIAITIPFIQQKKNLPSAVQRKVDDFLVKFMATPELPGTNYEVIQGSHKNTLHSARIDQEYRVIVGHPSKDSYLLLWVDKHDDAYHWAKGRRCEVHAQTGALQVYAVEEIRTEVFASPSAQPGIFANCKDKELLRIGVPQDLLPTLREICSDEDLEAKLPLFPAEVSDALYMMAAGTPYAEVLAQLEYAEVPESIDTSDIQAALARMESQKTFRALVGDRELNEVLSQSFEAWRVFLHPSQRKLVERDWNGPVRVLGGAGTGKTVCAMHRVRWLLQKRFASKDDRILFTTFTKNLAADIRRNLEQWVPDLMPRIEVLHLDAWVNRFLQEHFKGLKIVYQNEKSEAWRDALASRDLDLDLDEAFYRDEWEQVVLAQGCEDETSYLKARRVGRGTSLTGAQRKLVWKVFHHYRQSLAAAKQIESDDAMRLVCRYLQANQIPSPYRAIVVDEAQDLGYQAFALLRAIAGPEKPNDLFIVGDPHQRIYGKVANLSASGVNIRGRGRKLRINYRTTEEIRKEAVAELQGKLVDDLDAGTDSNQGYHSLLHGAKPMRYKAKDFASEVEFVSCILDKLLQEGVRLGDCCIVCRSEDYGAQVQALLEQKGISCATIQRDTDTNHSAKLNLATMHRVKGLEFDHVFVMGLCDSRFPLPPPSGLDGVAQDRWLSRERALLYVSMTRARKSVVITSW